MTPKPCPNIPRKIFQLNRTSPSVYISTFSTRCLHTSTRDAANPLPTTSTGPPPQAPVPAIGQLEERLARRRKQAELLKQGKAIRAAEANPASRLKRRFWTEVHVVKTEDGLQIHLDKRPIRTASKQILTVPRSKPLLAASIALEWDQLTSAQQALKQHLIPLTSLVSRAQALEEESADGSDRIRLDIVDMVMRYLDTDTLLCWTPVKDEAQDRGLQVSPEISDSTLRDIQIATAVPILEYLTTSVWPGIEIKPVTDSNSIIPVSQPEMTKQIIRGWVAGLPSYELAALERAVLAGKGLLGAVRLVVEWSPHWRHLRAAQAHPTKRFGIEEAAKAASLEVTWQTDMWGEVEDTHDVDREDLRRQLGSVVLLLSASV